MALEVVSTFLSAMVAAGRLTTAVPSLLRDPLDSPRARAALAERLATRQASFLSLVRRGVYEHLASPYRALLRGAGCELGDLQALVRERGVEGALAVLFQHGVYLSVDEFKGRRPVVRGSTTVAVDPSALRNPVAAAHVRFRAVEAAPGGPTSGSTPRSCASGPGTWASVFQSRGDGGPREYAIWLVPGGAVIVHVLEFALCRHAASTLVLPARSGLSTVGEPVPMERSPGQSGGPGRWRPAAAASSTSRLTIPG